MGETKLNEEDIRFDVSFHDISLKEIINYLNRLQDNFFIYLRHRKFPFPNVYIHEVRVDSDQIMVECSTYLGDNSLLYEHHVGLKVGKKVILARNRELSINQSIQARMRLQVDEVPELGVGEIVTLNFWQKIKLKWRMKKWA